MGGVLPVIPQRVLGIGGTAGMVHPSTGKLRNGLSLNCWKQVKGTDSCFSSMGWVAYGFALMF
jgi:hypothetical protein